MLHEKRDITLKVRLSAAEHKRLMVYAQTVNKPASFVVRSLILQLLYEQDPKTIIHDQL